MAKNKDLQDAVLNAMLDYLVDKDPALSIGAMDKEFGFVILENEAELRVDTDEKVRLHYSRFIGYGFDFAHDTQDRYEGAVQKTKDAPKHFENPETLVQEGVADDRFGWYITELK